MNDDYKKLKLKEPIESDDYFECSEFVIEQIEKIINETIQSKQNQIIINTNLKFGLPMENINKIAGPFIEAWAFEKFNDTLEDFANKYSLINVEAGERLNMADIILQFKRERKNQSSITGFVDVKATSVDIESSGKSPNITSFARIRTEYIKDPDYLFVILSIKHKVYSHKEKSNNIIQGVMEVVGFKAYDLKYISYTDLNYNPALGSGQLQIKDIHYVSKEIRSTWTFCQILDEKCIKSKKGFSEWFRYAKQYKWIKD